MLYPWIMLGIEANRVVGLRVMKLMLGGKCARREARMMVTEKIRAGLEANARLMAGASPDEVIRTYRRASPRMPNVCLNPISAALSGSANNASNGRSAQLNHSKGAYCKAVTTRATPCGSA
jgi:hypothetical protein